MRQSSILSIQNQKPLYKVHNSGIGSLSQHSTYYILCFFCLCYSRRDLFYFMFWEKQDLRNTRITILLLKNPRPPSDSMKWSWKMKRKDYNPFKHLKIKRFPCSLWWLAAGRIYVICYWHLKRNSELNIRTLSLLDRFLVSEGLPFANMHRYNLKNENLNIVTLYFYIYWNVVI